MKCKILIGVFCISCQAHPIFDGLVITEVMSQNTRTIYDEAGYSRDWIEIANTSDEYVHLNGLQLTDNLMAKKYWDFPKITLEPNESLLVFASGENLTDIDSPLHTNFKLNKDGEELYLLYNDELVDKVIVPTLPADVSYGRSTSNKSTFGYILKPSPGEFDYQEVHLLEDSQSRLKFSEVQYKKNKLIVDEFGCFSDWIEVRNQGEDPVELSQYFLSDDEFNLTKWRFSEQQLAANDEVIVFASKNIGERHTGFKIKEGETLYLSNSVGLLLDKVTIQPSPNGTMAKLEDQWTMDNVHPTPGYTNHDSVMRRIKINEVFTYSSGAEIEWIEFYNPSNVQLNLTGHSLHIGDEAVALEDYSIAAKSYRVFTKQDLPELKLPRRGSEVQVRYGNIILDTMEYGWTPYSYSTGRSMDGKMVFFSEPTKGTENSSKHFSQIALRPHLSVPSGYYSDPFTVTLQDKEKDTVTYYTLDGSEPTQRDKQFEGSFEIAESTIIRLRSYHQNKVYSDIASYSFLFESILGLPTAHVYIEHSKFFNSVYGLYRKGPSENPNPPDGYEANYWSNKKVPGEFALWDASGNEIFSQRANVRIHGGFTRMLPHKNLQVNAADKYGSNKFSFPFFPQRTAIDFSRVVLRGGGQSQLSFFFMDVFVHDMLSEFSLSTLSYQTVHLYLNERYWGLYNLREKLDEALFARKYGIDRDQVTLLMIGVNQVNDEWSSMIRELRKRKPKNEQDFAWLASQVDLSSLIDLYMYHIFIKNSDYGNCAMWKPNGGKWQFVAYDADMALKSTFNMGEIFYENEGFRFRSLRMLMRWLLKNPEFEETFLVRFAELYNGPMSVEKWNYQMDQYIDLYSEHVQFSNEQTRYPINWAESIDSLRKNYKYYHTILPSLLAEAMHIQKRNVDAYISQ